tara:strand:+ start:704 stop:907 length:204 start_codon:yes stop_codon:yes gene_type:complete
MKKVAILFLFAFVLFFLGQLLWTIGLIIETPLFGSNLLEEWVINLCFTSCSLFGIIASFKLYKQDSF